jgi:hypothetical protein
MPKASTKKEESQDISNGCFITLLLIFIAGLVIIWSIPDYQSKSCFKRTAISGDSWDNGTFMTQDVKCPN